MQRWALITGATSGIGWATAEILAQQGYSILALGRREERLAQLKSHLLNRTPAIEVREFIIDICQKDQLQKFFTEQAMLLKRVEVLVNNAGLAKGIDKIQDADTADWDTMIDTNVRALFQMTRGMLDFFLSRNSGHIVNLGSVAGRWTYPGGGVYCATKFAVRAFSEGLRMDLLGTKIRVTNIEPGMVHTEFSEVRLGDKTLGDKVYENMHPLQARDIAETIAWCLNRPPHVNIQELVIYPTDQAHVGQVARRQGGS